MSVIAVQNICVLLLFEIFFTNHKKIGPCAFYTFGLNSGGRCCTVTVVCDLQLIFEGLWSNQTHPKDFPFSLWLTHFSDVIGASHERNYSFWGEGQLASDGLRQVAEWGSVRGMEAELRAQVA